MKSVPQTIYCAVRAVGDGIESSIFYFTNFKPIEKASAHPPYYIEDERCGIHKEIS